MGKGTGIYHQPVRTPGGPLQEVDNRALVVGLKELSFHSHFGRARPYPPTDLIQGLRAVLPRVAHAEQIEIRAINYQDPQGVDSTAVASFAARRERGWADR